MSRRDADRWHRWTLRAATAVIVLATLAIVVLVATACRPADAPAVPSGTVTERHDETLPDGRRRATITVTYGPGETAEYRLGGDTACVVGATYPACDG